MNKYFEGFTENYESTCGESNFTVKKFEVYQLEIENKKYKNLFNKIYIPNI